MRSVKLWATLSKRRDSDRSSAYSPGASTRQGAAQGVPDRLRLPPPADQGLRHRNAANVVHHGHRKLRRGVAVSPQRRHRHPTAQPLPESTLSSRRAAVSLVDAHHQGRAVGTVHPKIGVGLACREGDHPRRRTQRPEQRIHLGTIQLDGRHRALPALLRPAHEAPRASTSAPANRSASPGHRAVISEPSTTQKPSPCSGRKGPPAKWPSGPRAARTSSSTHVG